jgi:hypothetical protein
MVKDLPGAGAEPPPILYRAKAAPLKDLPAGTLVPAEPLTPSSTGPLGKELVE